MKSTSLRGTEAQACRPEAACVCIHMHTVSKAAQGTISTSQSTVVQRYLEDPFLKKNMLEKQQEFCEGGRRRSVES